jgi:hypothetical protein
MSGKTPKPRVYFYAYFNGIQCRGDAIWYPNVGKYRVIVFYDELNINNMAPKQIEVAYKMGEYVEADKLKQYFRDNDYTEY